jgi:hypothetical protein
MLFQTVEFLILLIVVLVAIHLPPLVRRRCSACCMLLTTCCCVGRGRRSPRDWDRCRISFARASTCSPPWRSSSRGLLRMAPSSTFSFRAHRTVPAAASGDFRPQLNAAALGRQRLPWSERASRPYWATSSNCRRARSARVLQLGVIVRTKRQRLRRCG